MKALHKEKLIYLLNVHGLSTYTKSEIDKMFNKYGDDYCIKDGEKVLIKKNNK